MKKVLLLTLIFTLIISSTMFSFGTPNEGSLILTSSEQLFKGNINSPELFTTLQEQNVPDEVLNDILEMANDNKDGSLEISVSLSSYSENKPVSEKYGITPTSTVNYQSYVSTVYNKPLDAIETGSNATAISELFITSLGIVQERIGLFTSGYSILQYLTSIWGENSVYPQSSDYTNINGQVSVKTDKYTYCDLNDGSGYRLGLISQKLDNLNLVFETNVFHRNRMTWVSEVVKTLNIGVFTSQNFYSPNSKALSNVMLNMSQDERLSIKVGRIVFEIK